MGVEAVAACTPDIVIEQCGFAPHLANEAGLVVRHDKAELSRALERILSEAKLRSQLANGCANVASRLGWGEPGRDMEALYSTLASPPLVEAETKTTD